METILVTGGNGFIGTSVIEMMRTELKDYKVFILDLKAPQILLNSNEKWKEIDIMNYESLLSYMQEIRPGIVIHLAAETECKPDMTLEDYSLNTKGSKNIFMAANKVGVDFLVHTSTQFVHQSGDCTPKSDTDFEPLLPYGESKMISEQLLREGNYRFNWIIIRPTNIWGPRHKSYPEDFWRILKERKYFHPGRHCVLRSFGFVGNVAYQITKFVEKRNDPRVSRAVFYVGDKPICLYEWVNLFSLEILKKPVRVVPVWIFFMIAFFGQILTFFKIPFPLTLSRFKSMTKNNPAPMDKTFLITGEPKFKLEEGVRVTGSWLRDYWSSK